MSSSGRSAEIGGSPDTPGVAGSIASPPRCQHVAGGDFEVSMLVVMLDARCGEAALDARSAARLADLGVTHVAIARDDTIEAVVLEGWAFNPVASGAEATEIIAGTATRNTLHPVLQTLLTRTTK